MQTIAAFRCPSTDPDTRGSFFSKIHFRISNRHIVSDSCNRPFFLCKGIPVNRICFRCVQRQPCLLQLFKYKALQMNLLTNRYTDRIDAGNPFCQQIGFFLIGVPDGRLLINHIRKQLTVLFSWNSFIDPDGIFFTCQCKNRHRNFIGPHRSEINVSKCYHGFSIPCRCYAAFVSVADLSLIRGVQTS